MAYISSDAGDVKIEHPTTPNGNQMPDSFWSDVFDSDTEDTIIIQESTNLTEEKQSRSSASNQIQDFTGYIYLYAGLQYMKQRKFKLGRRLNFPDRFTITSDPVGSLVFFCEKVDRVVQFEKDLKEKYNNIRIKNYNGHLCEYIYCPDFLNGDFFMDFYIELHRWRCETGIVHVPSILNNVAKLNSAAKLKYIIANNNIISSDDPFSHLFTKCLKLIPASNYTIAKPPTLPSRKRQLEQQKTLYSIQKKAKLDEKGNIDVEDAKAFANPLLAECQQLCSSMTSSQMFQEAAPVCSLLERLLLDMNKIISHDHVYHYDSQTQLWKVAAVDMTAKKQLFHTVFTKYSTDVDAWCRDQGIQANDLSRVFRQLGNSSKYTRLDRELQLRNSRTEAKFDQPGMHIIHFRNGVYEVKTGTFRERVMQDFATTTLPHDYTPNAECSKWQSLLNTIFGQQSTLVNDIFQMALLFENQNLYDAIVLLISRISVPNHPEFNGRHYLFGMLDLLFGSDQIAYIPLPLAKSKEEKVLSILNNKRVVIYTVPYGYENRIALPDVTIRGVPIITGSEILSLHISPSFQDRLIAVSDRNLFMTLYEKRSYGIPGSFAVIPDIPQLDTIHFGHVASMLAQEISLKYKIIERKEATNWQAVMIRNLDQTSTYLSRLIQDERSPLQRFGDSYIDGTKRANCVQPIDVFKHYCLFHHKKNLKKLEFYQQIFQLWNIPVQNIKDLGESNGLRRFAKMLRP